MICIFNSPCPFTFTYLICDTSDLKQRLTDTSASISQNVTDEAVGQCRKRLRACVKAKGHHFEFEHLLNFYRIVSEPPTVYQGKHVMFRVISVAAI